MKVFKFRDDFAGWRSLLAGGDLHPDDHRCASAEDGEEFVRLSDHQSELSALQEELATAKSVMAHDYELLQQRLAAAEQRNAESSAALQLATRLLASGLSALNPRAGLAKNVRAFLESQRKPTESGASE